MGQRITLESIDEAIEDAKEGGYPLLPVGREFRRALADIVADPSEENIQRARELGLAGAEKYNAKWNSSDKWRNSGSE
jgi:hypothetical protein